MGYCTKMKTKVIISNSSFLIRVDAEEILYIASDGSYTNMTLTDGRQHVFSFNLSSFEKLLEQQLGPDSAIFVRLGRCLIINVQCIYSIDIIKQELILVGKIASKEYNLNVPKDALKNLKKLLEYNINRKRIEL